MYYYYIANKLGDIVVTTYEIKMRIVYTLHKIIKYVNNNYSIILIIYIIYIFIYYIYY